MSILKHKKLSDIKNGLQSAISVVEHFQKWRKGEIKDIIFAPKEISLALTVVMEAAKVLLILEKLESQKSLNND